MRSILAAALMLAIQAEATYPGVHPAQVAELRSYARESYFRFYCVAVNTGELPHDATREALLESTRQQPDPPTGLMAELRDITPRFAPASACEMDIDGDIRHRSTRARPSLLVVVGPVQVVSTDRVRFIVYTSSGSLTETHALVEFKRCPDGWEQVSATILLQA